VLYLGLVYRIQPWRASSEGNGQLGMAMMSYHPDKQGQHALFALFVGRDSNVGY